MQMVATIKPRQGENSCPFLNKGKLLGCQEFSFNSLCFYNEDRLSENQRNSSSCKISCRKQSLSHGTPIQFPYCNMNIHACQSWEKNQPTTWYFLLPTLFEIITTLGILIYHSINNSFIIDTTNNEVKDIKIESLLFGVVSYSQNNLGM